MIIADAIVQIALGVGLLAIGFTLEKEFGSAGFMAGLVIIIIVSIAFYVRSSDCHTDWDGRSNPMVCE